MSTLAVVIIFAVLITAQPIFGPTASYMLLHNGLLSPIFAMGVVGLALGGGPVYALCSRPLVILLGESAYAIYMLHFPFLAYSLIVLVGMAKDNPHLLPWPMTYTIFFLVAISLISVWVHKKWEIPWRRKIRHRMLRLWPEKEAA
jgi:peptidoglycan/LPS O-acetylase OafA/YrhL